MKKSKKIILIFILILGVIITSFLAIKYYPKEWERSKFDLRDKIPIKIEYQIRATYASCYAFAALDSIETNLMLHQNRQFDFSESHVEYMTSNLLGGERKLNNGGGFRDILKYVEEGKGPVLESEIPNKEYQPKEYEKLKNAKPILKNVQIKEFFYDDMKEEDIKRHIVENGSIYVGIFFASPVEESIKQFYNPETYGYCNLNKKEVNHIVSIIGWDDTYSKENFPEENRPKEDGAYLAMCFWKGFENDHVIYLSYEDIALGKYMVGVTNCELNEEYK